MFLPTVNKLPLISSRMSDSAETGLYGFIITNVKKSRSTNEKLGNFSAMDRSPTPYLIGLRVMITNKGDPYA